MKTITLSVSQQVYDLLTELSEKREKSKSEIIRELIKKEYEQSADISNKNTEVRTKAISRGELTVQEIVRQMKNNGLYDADSVPEALIRNIIASVAGYDERTISKYFNILYRRMLLPDNIEFNRRHKMKSNFAVR